MLKIAIDLDGVIYEWEKTARYMLREIRGCSGLREESEYWNWIQEQVDNQDWNWLWRHAPELGLWRHGHVVTGAILAVRELKARHHKLLLVTARPEGAVKDTHAWVNFHFGAERPYPWSDIRILGDREKKSSVPADILIDDKPENIEEWLSAGKRRAILFDRNWNGDFTPIGAERGLGWRHTLRIVERMASCS